MKIESNGLKYDVMLTPLACFLTSVGSLNSKKVSLMKVLEHRLDMAWKDLSPTLAKSFNLTELNRQGTRQRISRVVLSMLIVFSAVNVVQAQGIYKWTDAQGKVHYGDKQVAPQKSQKIAETEVKVEAPRAKPGDKENPVAEVQAFGNVSAERIKKCIGFASEIARIDGSKDTIKSMSRISNLHDKIRMTCSYTGFDCLIDDARPEENRCSPFVWNGRGVLVRGKINGAQFETSPGR